MKKVGTIILTIYITLATVAAGLFGYLYFSGRSKDKMTNREVVAQLASNVHTAILGNETGTTAMGANHSTTFTSEVIENYLLGTNYNPNDIEPLENFASGAILLADYVMENELEENTYYRATLHEDLWSMGDIDILFIYKLGKAKLTINLFDLTNNYARAVRMYYLDNTHTTWIVESLFQDFPEDWDYKNDYQSSVGYKLYSRIGGNKTTAIDLETAEIANTIAEIADHFYVQYYNMRSLKQTQINLDGNDGVAASPEDAAQIHSDLLRITSGMMFATFKDMGTPTNIETTIA